MSESNFVNNEVISREQSKDMKFKDIIDESKIQEVINIFCKDLTKINALDECGWTPLYRTVIAGDLTASHILIQKGADPNIQCSMGETPLYQAVDMCKLDQVKLLIKNGANPNITQDDGLSPLHAAVFRQNILIIKYLLKHGANPNIKSKIYLQSPVHLAIKNNVDPMIILILVQFNGSLLDKDKFGKKPIDYISSKEMRETIEKLKFEKNPNKKLVLVPSFQTPKKYKNWAISKVYSNTIRSNSSIRDLNFNSNTVLKDAGKLKYNIIGTNRHDRYKKMKSCKNLGEEGKNKNNKNIEKIRNKEIVIINNENNISDLEKEKENFEPYLKKRKISFGIKEECSCVLSDNGDSSLNERININNSFFIKNKNDRYQKEFEEDKLKINRLSNIIFPTKKIKINKDIIENIKQSEYSKNLNNFVKIPKNTKSIFDKSYNSYDIEKKNINNKPKGNIINEQNNYKFVQIYGNSKAKKGSFSINPENQRRIQNKSLDINEYNDAKSDKNVITSKYLYTKPILGLNDLNNKRLNLSHTNINYNSSNIISKNKFEHNKDNNSNNKNIIIQNSNNMNSTNKKNASNIKRLFTFMEKENININNSTNNKSNDLNNNKEENSKLLNGNDNNINKSRNKTKDSYCEKNNSYSNLDCDRKTCNISYINSNRNNTSTLNDDSLMNTYLWKFKTIEDDNVFKKINGNNTTITTCSFIDLTSRNQNGIYPIYDWLKEINLAFYYNLFIEKKIYNLDKVISNLKNGVFNITKNDIIKIGITTPGHIYRIITKMEIDSEKINRQISNFLLGKKNSGGEGEMNILKNSIIYCCGCCSINNQSKYYSSNDAKRYQLELWLERIKMNKYKDNFIKNGFDMLEYFILQMFSSIPIDENILKEDLKINNINDRDLILLQINKDIKYITQKTNKSRINNSWNEIMLNKNIYIEKKSDKKEIGESSNCIVF